MERPRLLLADDSLTIQRVVNLTFAEQGMDVIAVGDGDAAIREIAGGKPDIVLADVHMPGPGGLEICSLLRGVEDTEKIPVILLVGAFEPFDPGEAERAGADAFVTKPFQSIRELVEQVKQLLSSRQQEPEPVVPATEVQAGDRPVEVDTTDIDSLYQQSFAETIEMSPEVAAQVNAAPFTSDQLDDEMIETSYSSESPDESDQPAPDFDQTIVSGAPNHSPAPAYAAEPASQDIATLETEPLSIDDANFAAYEETLQMDAPPAGVQVVSSEGSAHTAPTEELRRDPFATTTDAFDLDDLDLLDLTASQVEDKYSFGTPTQAVEGGSNKQVVTISPELLEIIVQKVVEKLSEKY